MLSRGRSFVVVSGLGGVPVAKMGQAGSWWAVKHARQHGAKFGALFCTFFASGDPKRAECYFKDVAGDVADRFQIYSALPD